MCRDTVLNTGECLIPGADGRNSMEKQLVHALSLYCSEIDVLVLWLFL